MLGENRPMINTFNDEVINAAVFKQQADNNLSGAMSSGSFTRWVEPYRAIADLEILKELPSLNTANPNEIIYRGKLYYR
jgi:hypothetical protein